MKILHILDHSTPLQSGYVTRTLSIMRTQRDLGLEPLALTLPRHEAGIRRSVETPDYEECAGFTFYRTPAPERARFGPFSEMAASARRIREVAQKVQPDILHAHSPALNGLPAASAGRALGLPVVYEIRAFWEDAAVDHGTTHKGSLRYRATRALETLACRRVNHIVAICEGLRADLMHRRIPGNKITVVPNAVDLPRYQPISAPDAALQDELNLGPGPVLGFVGSFYAYEGLDLLIEAMPQILRKWPEAVLLLVGGGPQEEALRQRAETLGGAIRFTGRVPGDQVARYYSLIDLLVFPRKSIRLTELVTPLKPLEAMASTRSFLASDIGGHRELVRGGHTGTLFAPDSADSLARAVLEFLALPAEEKARLRENGLKFVTEERNWKACAARYRPVYERLKGVSAPNPP